MNKKEEKVAFTSADGEKLEFYVIEQTRINNIHYLLAEDTADEEQAYILKETAGDALNGESVYEFVEDDIEFEAISKVFNELLDDIDIQI